MILRYRRKPEIIQRDRRRTDDAVQTVLALPTLEKPARDAILQAHAEHEGSLSAEQGRWAFVMISRQDVREAMRLIQGAPRPDATLRLFLATLTHVRMDTGELMAARERLGEDAFLKADEVSRGLHTLKRLGIVHDRGDGRARRWFMNPRVAWAGSLAKREVASRTAPQLHLIEP